MTQHLSPEQRSLFGVLLMGGLFFVASFLVVFRLAQEEGLESGKQRSIITTTGMIGDIAHELAGDFSKVTSLIGPTVDPHLYSATRSDMQKLLNGEVVLFNGLFLEGRLLQPLLRLSAHRKNAYPLGDALNSIHLIPSDEDGKHFDPHIWMDPVLWKIVVHEAGERLQKHFPEHESLIANRTQRYTKQLDKLHEYSTLCLSTIPKESRILITAHDAFHYFGKRYGFQVLGVQGLSTESEAGLKDIENFIRIIVEHRVQAIFIESTVSPRNMQALIEGARRRGQEVEIGGELFADAMGPKDTPAGTYVGMIQTNIETITNALGGECKKGEEEIS